MGAYVATFTEMELTPFESARHFYGSELRRLRKKIGLGLDKLAEKVPSSKSHLHRIELAESMPPPGLSEALDRLFTTEEHFARLYQLVCREIHPGKYKDFMRQEQRAHTIEHFGSQVMWGLLQTEAYARAFFRYDDTIPESTIEERVAARVARQERLSSDTPPRLWAILDEAVLQRPVGGPHVMRDQLARLLPLVETPYSKIQILPFSHGGHALMNGSMTLLKLPGGVASAWEEGREYGQLIVAEEEVIKRARFYDALRAYALPPHESAVVIRQAMEAYE